MLKKLLAILLTTGILFTSYLYFKERQAVQNFRNKEEIMPILTQNPEEEGDFKEFVIEGSNFKFEPDEIKVKMGDRVRVRFKNLDGGHDFVMEEFGVATRVINGGEDDVVEFVAEKKGQFEYHCSVNGHRQLGMRGKLIID